MLHAVSIRVILYVITNFQLKDQIKKQINTYSFEILLGTLFYFKCVETIKKDII